MRDCIFSIWDNIRLVDVEWVDINISINQSSSRHIGSSAIPLLGNDGSTLEGLALRGLFEVFLGLLECC